MNIIDVKEAVRRLSSGDMIILTDNHDRENEGDILVLAELIEEKHVDFMTKHARGLICVPLGSGTADRLQLQPMVSRNTATHETAFTVSVDAANGGTGISVSDRSETIRRLTDPKSMPEALARPGHIFPLIAKDGGVLERDGHTEASIELARLCGKFEAGVICEILSEGAGMAEGQELQDFAEKHGLGILSISDLREFLIRPEAESRLSTKNGEFTIQTFNDGSGSEPAVVLHSAAACKDTYLPVRIHSECFTGDLLGSLHCDCGSQLNCAMEYISEHGGMLIYLRQEGRGIGLSSKIQAYELQRTEKADTFDANLMLGHQPDEREYSLAVSILKQAGVSRVGLLTNNPDKLKALKEAGLEVKRIPLEIEVNKTNYKYLKTKKDRFNHMILEGETA